MFRRQFTAIVLVSAMLAIAIGCAGNKSTSETGGAAAGPLSKTLTVAAAGVVSSLDPERYQGALSIDLLPNVTGTLVRFKKPQEGAKTLQAPTEIEGDLAESWTMAPDGKSATFKLRQGVMSSAGKPLTSEDVRWSIERMKTSKGVPIAKIIMGIGGWDMTDNTVKVVDDRTVTINFSAPNAVSVAILSTYFFGILDSKTVIANGGADPLGYDWLAKNTAGFGPYMIKSFDPGVEARLVANPNYHRGASQFTEVIVRAVADVSSRLQLIQTKSVDIAYGLTFDQFATLQAGDKAIRLGQPLYASIDVLVPNSKVKPLDDARVRQALGYGIDRDAILKAAYHGLGTISTDFFHDAFGVPGVKEPIKYDPERAKRLLAEAGLPRGFELTIAYNIASVGAQIQQVAVLMQSQLAAIGVTVKLQEITSGPDFDAAKRSGTLQAWFATTNPLVPDPGYYVQVSYETKGLNNQSGYTSPVVDDLSRKILETPAGNDRNALITRLNDLMIGEMPAIPVVDTPRFYAFNGVKGFLPYPQGNVNFFELTSS